MENRAKVETLTRKGLQIFAAAIFTLHSRALIDKNSLFEGSITRFSTKIYEINRK